MLRFKLSDFATFTDRDTQIAAFHRLLGDSAEARVYVFGGLSGNGKSFLVDYLILHELPQGTPYALVDFEAVPGLVTDAATWADSLIPVLEPLPRRAVESFHSTRALTMAQLSEGLRSLQIRQTVNVRGDSRTDIYQDINLSGLVEELYKVARREIANALIALARTGSQGRAPRVLFLDGYEFLRRDDERYET